MGGKRQRKRPIVLSRTTNYCSACFFKMFFVRSGARPPQVPSLPFSPRASNSEIHGEREGGFRQ